MAAAKKLRIRTKKESVPRTPKFDDFERIESGIPHGDISVSDMEDSGEMRARIEEGMNRHGFRQNYFDRNF